MTALPMPVAELRRQEDVTARNALGECFSDEFLGMAAAVGVRGVPMRDPLPVRLEQRRLGKGVIVAAPADRGAVRRARTAMPPCAEADGRDLSIRAAKP